MPKIDKINFDQDISEYLDNKFEINKIDELEKMGEYLKIGEFDKLFALVGLVNQSDPNQEYLVN